jgi:hypothetical protein
MLSFCALYRRRIPPRSLVPLAHKYYDTERMQQLAGDVEAINFLNSPPEWALASTIEPDSPLKKKRRKKGSSKNEEERLIPIAEVQQKSKQEALIKEVKYPRAVVAAGIGPDGDGDVRRRRKRRKRMRTGAIVIGVLSILIGMVGQFVPSSSNSPKVPAKVVDVDLIRRVEEEVASAHEKDDSLVVADVNSLLIFTEGSKDDDVDEEIVLISTEGSKDDDVDEETEPTDSEDQDPPVAIVEVPELETKQLNNDAPDPPSNDSGRSQETSDNGGSSVSKPIKINSNNNSKRTKSPEVSLIYSGSRSPAAQKVSAFVHQNLRPVYMEARVIAQTTKETLEKNMKPKKVGRKIYTEAIGMARSTKDALTEEAEVVFL